MIHLVAAGFRQVLGFTLGPGQAPDSPAGRDLLTRLGIDNLQVPLWMDRACEGNETGWLAQSLGFDPVVPPLRTRLDPWSYDTDMYKGRNEIERLFGRIKRFRRIFTRYEMTDLKFCGLITITLITDMLG